MMENFKKEWEAFHTQINKEINTLKGTTDKLESKEAKAEFLKKILNSHAKFVTPILGIPYNRQYYNVKNVKIDADSSQGINKIRLYIGKPSGWECWIQHETEKDAIKTKILELGYNHHREYNLEKFVNKKFSKNSYQRINTPLQELLSSTKKLIETLPEPFTKRKDSLNKTLQKEREEAEKFYAFSKKLKELEGTLKQTNTQLKEYTAPINEEISLTIDELLDIGAVPKIKPGKLEKPVVNLFKSRSQKVPQILKELEQKEPESLHRMQKLLEAEAKKELKEIKNVPLKEAREDLAYYKNCGVPIEEYKKTIISSAKEKERKRKKELNKQLREIKET